MGVAEVCRIEWAGWGRGDRGPSKGPCISHLSLLLELAQVHCEPLRKLALLSPFCHADVHPKFLQRKPLPIS